MSIFEQNGASIPDGSIGVVKLSATGAPDNTTFLRGDNTWAAPAGGGDMLASNNLSDLVNSTTALTNLGFTASITELNYTNGVTSAIQTQINGKAASSHNHILADITDSGALAALATVGTAQIDNNSVTLAKLADMATASFVGRNTAATGDPEILSAVTARSILNVENGATADQTTEEIQDAAWAAVSTGAQTGITVTYQDATNDVDFVVTNAAAIGNLSGTNTGDQTITLTGDVTGTGTGSFATTISADAVDIAMLSATGMPDNTTFLRGDNTWATPAGSGDMVLAGVQTVTGAKTFNSGKMLHAGSTSGTTELNAAAIAGTTVITMPATTGTMALTSDIPTDVAKGQLAIDIDGAGSAITTGTYGYWRVPYDCTIDSNDLVADVSGSIVLDVWVDAYANYPPTVADTVTASAKPTLSTAIKSQDATLTGWTTSLTEGDYIGVNVDSVATITKAVLSLNVTRT